MRVSAHRHSSRRRQIITEPRPATQAEVTHTPYLRNISNNFAMFAGEQLVCRLFSRLFLLPSKLSHILFFKTHYKVDFKRNKIYKRNSPLLHICKQGTFKNIFAMFNSKQMTINNSS